VVRVGAIVLILLGTLLLMLSGSVLLAMYQLCFVDPASPNYLLQKLRMLFAIPGMGKNSLPFLAVGLAGLFLAGRGIYLLLLHTPGRNPYSSPRRR
jgi:hypothetical protein